MNPVDPTRRTSVLFWFFCAAPVNFRVLAAADFVCFPVLCWPAVVGTIGAAGFCAAASSWPCVGDAALSGRTDAVTAASTAIRRAATHAARRQYRSRRLTMKRDAVGGLNTSS